MRLTVNSKNILFLFSGDILSRFLGFLATMYLARVLGTSNFGIIHIGLAVLAYTMIFGNSGLTFLGIRKIAGEDENISKLTGNILFSRLLLSGAAFLVAIIFVLIFMHIPGAKKVTLIYLLALFPASLLLEWFFQGKKEMGIIAGGRLLTMACYLGVILIFVHNGNDLTKVAWGWTAGVTANSLLLIFIFKSRNYLARFDWNFQEFKKLLKTSFPLGAAELISQVVMQFPAIYLAIVATTSEVGLFSAAFKLIILLLIFDRVFYLVFFPAISRYSKQEPEKLTVVFNNVLKIISTFALFLGLCAILSAAFLVKFIFSTDFTGAIPVFQIMVIYFIITMINSVFSFTLIGMEKEKFYTKSLLAGMIAFFITLLIAGKPFGANGAAMAFTIYIITSLLYMVYHLRVFLPFNFLRTVVLPFIFTVGVCLPLLWNLDIMLPAKLAVSTFVCLPLIALINGLGISEIKYLKRSLIWS